jgi:hypothetical protein
MHVAQTPASVIAHTQTADVRTQRVWYVDFNMFTVQDMPTVRVLGSQA